MKKVNSQDFLDIFLAVLFSLIFSVVLVVAFACLLKWFEWGDNVVAPVNIAIKVMSILFGSLAGIRNGQKGLLKGFFIGVIYTVLTYCVYSLILSSWKLNPMTIFDFLAGIITSVISGVLTVNVKKVKV